MNEERPKKRFLVKKRIEIDYNKQSGESPNVRNAKETIKKIGRMAAALNKGLSSQSLTLSSTNAKKTEKAQSPEPNDMDAFNEDPAFCEVSGPQLRMDKNYLSFIEKTGNLAKDFVRVTNNGSTAIYYKWKKLDKPAYFGTVLLDKDERFFCHANKNVIKPGQTKIFYFTFKSRTTGIFEEEWILECEPPLLIPLPPVKLSGHAIQDDPNTEWRSELDMVMDAKHKHRFITEILNDVFDEVRTPTPPLPDLDNPEVCKREFEEKNAKYHVYYTPLVMNLYRNLQALIYEELHLRIEDLYWDLNIDFLVDQINLVRENAVRENLLRRWNDLLVLAKKKPLDRSPIFDYVKNALVSLVKEFPATVNNVRREKELMEINFSEPVELTPEELKKKQDEEAKAKAEFLKKQKKKPKNEEEEKKIIDEYKAQVTTQVIHAIGQNINILHENDPLVRAYQQLTTRVRPNKEYFEMLASKKTIKDLDIEEKRILLRIHLKTKEKPPAKPVEEERPPTQEAEVGKDNKGKVDPKDPKAKEKPGEKPKEEQKQQQQQQPKVVVKEKKVKKTKEEIAEELAKQKEEEAKKLFIESIDEKSLAEAVSVIKMCLEQLAKLVIVLVSYGEPHGRPNPNTTLKYFWEYMRENLDQICNFEETLKIEDFQERVESEVYPSNSALILENIFHEPEEVGYVYDEGRNLHKVDDWQIQEFTHRISAYAPVYIIEDLYNLYKNYTSLTKFKTEMTIFGPILSNDLVLVPQAILHCAFEPKKSSSRRKKIQEEPVVKKTTIAVIGGEFTADAILALDTLLSYYDAIYIMGKIGVLFLMHKLGLKTFSSYALTPHQQHLIDRLYRNAIDLGKKIYVPDKLIVAPKPEVKEDVPEWITTIYTTKFVYPDGYEQYLKELAEKEPPPPVEPPTQKKDAKKAEPPKKDAKGDPKKNEKAPPPEELPEDPASKNPDHNLLVVGYEESFLQELEGQIGNARNIFWIGSLEPMLHPGLNESNQSFVKTIYHVKEERKQKTIPNAIPVDWLVTCVGEEVQLAINSFDIIVEPTPPVASKKEEDGLEEEQEEEEEKSAQDEGMGSKVDVESASKATQQEKRNNLGLVADAFSGNTPFVLSLLAGTYLETLDVITNYEKKNEDEEEEDFSFLDEI